MTETLSWNTPMLVSAIIMILTFVGIFTEGVHGFHRTKFAMAGAGIMILLGQYFGFYSPRQAVESIDWNVVFLLGAMMTIVGIMIPTGGFQAIAYRIADISKGKQFMLLALMGTAVTVLSLLLDNVTTVVIFGPLIVLICQALRVSPIPYLLGAALLSDTGGVATLVGDPPNLMIGSAAHIDFNTFFIKMGPLVLVAWLAILAALKVLFREEIAVPAQTPDFTPQEHIKDKRTWYAALGVLAMMVVLFIFHHALNWNAWFVAALGLTLLVFIARNVDLDASFEDVELSLLMFFVSLFVVIGGVENSHFLEYVAQFIQPFVETDLLLASIVLMWSSAILSAMIDNIPFTAAMVPIILGMETQGINVAPLWWSLVIGVGMGGNGTHLGSTANVFIVTLSERLAKDANDPALALTPGLWFKKGTPAMILTLITSSLILWLFFDFFAMPIHPH
ncbi:citrate transporter [Methylocaldum marinum]|uniref:Citrate transporter n=1 Tax=Methylocaldum marinum TaxID=1432792 RepID=A0A250KTJ5_9GAMM|nr:SLC13 family permease [Methylocaldum marinum]BBA34892.1 citrate transporter [Methylocaldum marinum]